MYIFTDKADLENHSDRPPERVVTSFPLNWTWSSGGRQLGSPAIPGCPTQACQWEEGEWARLAWRLDWPIYLHVLAPHVAPVHVLATHFPSSSALMIWEGRGGWPKAWSPCACVVVPDEAPDSWLWSAQPWLLQSFGTRHMGAVAVFPLPLEPCYKVKYWEEYKFTLYFYGRRSGYFLGFLDWGVWERPIPPNLCVE